MGRSGLSERIRLLPGDARDTPWPDEQDVVFMSYLLSAVAGGDIPDLLTHAFTVLRPGGRLVVHDFMLDETRSGPLSAALFFTTYLANQPDAVSFTAEEISAMMEQAGFVEPTVEEMIPDITMMVAARKPVDG